MLNIKGEEWWLTAVGDYETAAVETMRFDGSQWQRVIALRWPARRNHGKEFKTIRLMISPEDALGLAEVLTHTARWLMEAAEVFPEEPSD
jgi:hypothetical protein